MKRWQKFTIWQEGFVALVLLLIFGYLDSGGFVGGLSIITAVFAASNVGEHWTQRRYSYSQESYSLEGDSSFPRPPATLSPDDLE